MFDCIGSGIGTQSKTPLSSPEVLRPGSARWSCPVPAISTAPSPHRSDRTSSQQRLSQRFHVSAWWFHHNGSGSSGDDWQALAPEPGEQTPYRFFPQSALAFFSQIGTDDGPKSGLKVIWRWWKCSLNFFFYQLENVLSCISSTGLFTNETALTVAQAVPDGEMTCQKRELVTKLSSHLLI